MRGLVYGMLAGLMTWGSAQAQNDAPVRIGVLDDMSGVYADLAGESDVVATRMAIADFGGKVLGRPIELLVADHQSKPDLGVSIARRWYDEMNVDAIVGIGSSAVALGVRALAREKGKIDLASAPGIADLSGPQCSPTGFQWSFDTYSAAKTVANATVKSVGETWFLVVADYSYGQALERDLTKFVTESGGKVLGSVRHPLGTPDFASFLLHAQGSKAKIVGLANAGADTSNAIKQASEFGLRAGGQALAVPQMFISDVKAIGLPVAQGLFFADGFYWDRDDATREFSRRFIEQRKILMPNTANVSAYTATTHYLKAVQAAGTTDPKTVAAKMKELPVNDFSIKNGHIREDGRFMRPMYLFQVKTPEESKGPWDLLKTIREIAPEDAWRPMSEGGCPFVKASAK